MVKKFIEPFANAGNRTPIPDATQVSGNVSYEEGYGPDYSKQLGVDPAAKNIGREGYNAVLFDVTESIQAAQTGQRLPFDAPLAAAIGGYPRGAVVARTDGNGGWISQASLNSSNPEVDTTTNWLPVGVVGTHTSATYTDPATFTTKLTNIEAGFPTIIASGIMNADSFLVVPNWKHSWIVDNRTTGTLVASITIKTATGTGATIARGTTGAFVCDGVNVKAYGGSGTGGGGSGADAVIKITGNPVNGGTLDNGAAIIPTGTSNQRPLGAPIGAMRNNTDLNKQETHIGGDVWQYSPDSAEFISYDTTGTTIAPANDSVQLAINELDGRTPAAGAVVIKTASPAGQGGSPATGAAVMPVGTTLQRPAASNPASLGFLRYNTDTNDLELYAGPVGVWQSATGSATAANVVLKVTGAPLAGGTLASGAIVTPSGTTAQRPLNPVQGYMRFNTSLRPSSTDPIGAEVYSGVSWQYTQYLASTTYYDPVYAGSQLIATNVQAAIAALDLRTPATTTGFVSKVVGTGGGADTGAAIMPTGTTAQRPATPLAGYTRNNTTINKQEIWTGTAWQFSPDAAIDISFTPTGSIAANNVQAAIVEVMNESASTTNVVAKVPGTGGGVDTGAAVIPTGTTAQRPAAPVAGWTRNNTDLNKMETWTGTAWQFNTNSATDTSFVPAGSIVAVNVQTAIQELDAETIHIANAATAAPVAPATTAAIIPVGTTAQRPTGLALTNGLMRWNSESTTGLAAAGNLEFYRGAVAGWVPLSALTTTFSPTGNIAATNVQAAIAELDTEKASLLQNNDFGGRNKFSASVSEQKIVLGTSGAVTINLALGNYFTCTPAANIQFSLSNQSAAGTADTFILEIFGGGLVTISWWGIKFPGGLSKVPTLSTTMTDVLGFYNHSGPQAQSPPAASITWNCAVLGIGMSAT